MANQKIREYSIISILGEGTYSTVYKAIKFNSQSEETETYAIKLIKLTEFDEKEKENILNEVRILASFKHPNIIEYVESFVIQEREQLW